MGTFDLSRDAENDWYNTFKRHVPEIVHQAGWTWLLAGESTTIADNGCMIVIGVAFWSQSDIRILDAVADRLLPSRVPVVVFDLDYVIDAATFDERLPNIPLSQSSPLLALYTDGKMVKFGVGSNVLEVLEDLPCVV